MNLAEFADNLSKQPMPEPPQSLLLYGATLTGRKSLLIQLAAKYKVIWIDIDNSYQTLFSALSREHWDNVTLIKCDDSQETPRAARMLTKLFRTITPVKICDQHGDIACPLCIGKPHYEFDPKKLDSNTVIVVSCLKRLSDSALAHVMGFTGELVFKKKEYTHWDNQGLILKGILTAQKRMLCHRAFITNEEELAQEDGTKKLTPVCGTRNFSTVVAGYFHHVIYTSIRNKKHCISSSTISDVRVQAGSCNQVDVKSVKDFIDIFKVVYSEQGKKSALQFSAESDVVAELEASKASKDVQDIQMI